MIKSDNPFWAMNVVPNLPHQHIPEYMTMLGSYADCHLTSARPSYNPGESTWCFPFIDVDESFDHGDFEDWTEMVERDMMERHLLSEWHFSC
jgi:hypothetical protein